MIDVGLIRCVMVLLSVGLAAVPAAYGAEQPAGSGHSLSQTIFSDAWTLFYLFFFRP